MDKITRKRRSWNMSRIRGKNTNPELIVRKYLFKEGYRYRVNYKIEGKPDIAFPKHKIVIFIHGCFWHRHGCSNSVIPKSNSKFWSDKLGKNIKRDQVVEKILQKKGWEIYKIWECQLEKKPELKLNKLHVFLQKFF